MMRSMTKLRKHVSLSARPSSSQGVSHRTLTKNVLHVLHDICYTCHVLLFPINLRPGKPVFDQLVQAFHHALVSGQLCDGDSFPSVRALSRELKISPTTAHKVVAHLKDRGFLVSLPGVGMQVAAQELPDLGARLDLLEGSARQLVREARDLSISKAEMADLLDRLWAEGGPDEAK
ncbi:MAG: GntR family transcriptional regulator [Verrucomicrobiota bacterium]